MQTPASNLQFAICIAAEEDGDLEVWKLYQVLPDAKAQEVGCLRVIDESGEDYLYPKNYFVMIELPETVQLQLLTIRP
jgi:hypothetical protein